MGLIPGGVRLRMEQSGFREEETRNDQGAEYGWNRYFERLPQGASTAP